MFTWLVIAIWFFIRAYTEEISIKNSFSQLAELLTYKQFVFFIHILFLVLYVLVLLYRYFKNIAKNKGLKVMFKMLILRCFTPVLLLYLGVNYILTKNSIDTFKYEWKTTFENTTGSINNLFKEDSKFRGMNVFGWHRSNKDDIDELIANNVEWIAVVPFLYQKDESSKTLTSRFEVGNWTRRDSTFINTINIIKGKGLYAMLKPHIWMTSGWRSNIELNSEGEWNTWFDVYRNAMLHYATMAELTNVDLLCIGTELRTSIKNQPDLWIELIKDIRKIYSGKITYAANWYDEYEHVAFWKHLDYIGIQGYFPLTEHKTPEISDIIQGWQKHKNKLQEFSKLHNKPILFTEIGYRSDASTTIKPWKWNSLENMLTNQRSTLAQQNAYEAMFKSLWNEPWFAGCFLWQWDMRTTKEQSAESFDFSPKHKPAQNIMAKWYGKYNLLNK